MTNPPSNNQTPPPGQPVGDTPPVAPPAPQSPPPQPTAPAPSQTVNPQTPPPTTPPQPQATQLDRQKNLSTKVLLLVEDDPLLINMYQSKFSSEGFQVFTATDGEAGLALVKSEKPDIVILDIMMPKLDGIEVLRRIRQDPALKDIPVLMLSNLSEAAKQREAAQLGAKEFLVKANLTPTQVVQKIKQHLGITQ
jgi:CheY-like chemotaxis protein